MEDPSSPTGEKIIPVLEQLRLKEEEIARLQEQMRQQLTKEREMAELRRQISEANIILLYTAGCIANRLQMANIILLYTLCAIMHVHVHTLSCSKHM